MTLGRPTLYDPKFCEMLVEHMSKGFSYESFAGVVSVSLDTLYNWEHLNPDFSEAKKIAVNKCRIFWEQTGIHGAWGGKAFQPAVWIFQMKNKFKWTDRVEIESDSLKAIVLQYKPEDLEK